MEERTVHPPQAQPYKVAFPQDRKGVDGVAHDPFTVAPPISGEAVVTATYTPGDADSWQNEPGPGAGELPRDEVVERSVQQLEPVQKVAVAGQDADDVPDRCTEGASASEDIDVEIE